ncbi:MAG: hypothetical protein J7K12_00635 [Thermoplasmata archaeon]|nr:hypothetical protein [Thermoplasmata archaeon]
MKIEDDELLGEFFDTPEKKARWLRRVTLLYIIWIIFVILGIAAALLYWLI